MRWSSCSNQHARVPQYSCGQRGFLSPAVDGPATSLDPTHLQLKPKTVHPNSFVSMRAHLQAMQKAYYDRTAHPLSPSKTGDPVYVQMAKGHWEPVKITGPCSTPRSFNVETEDGRVYRRNRCFLRHKVANCDSGRQPREA